MLIFNCYSTFSDAHYIITLLPPCSDPSCRVPAGRGRPSAPSTSHSPCRCRRLAERAKGERRTKKPWETRGKMWRNSTENGKKAGFMMDLCWLMWVFVDDRHAICIICNICHLPYHHIYINHLRGHPQNHSCHSWLVVLAVPILKNDGVKVNGVGMTYIIFLKFQSPPTR